MAAAALCVSLTAPRALTHWPTLARPASGRALLCLSPAGWRQRLGPRRAGHWDGSGLQRFLCPAPARPAPPTPAAPAPAPPARVRAPPTQPLARDAGTPSPFPPAAASGQETARHLHPGPREGAGECGEISGPGSWHGEARGYALPLPDAALPRYVFVCHPAQAGPAPSGGLRSRLHPLPPGTRGRFFFNLSPLGVHLRAPRAASADAVPVCPDGAG